MSCHHVLQAEFVLYVLAAVNVKKWEDTVAEDERELEKLKKDENKQMKVLLIARLHYC